MVNCILIAHVLVNAYGTQIVTDTQRLIISSKVEQKIKVYECPEADSSALDYEIEKIGYNQAQKYFVVRNKSK
jgi:hypothetical protein